jgi:biotin carboxyl carrier protein
LGVGDITVTAPPSGATLTSVKTTGARNNLEEQMESSFQEQRIVNTDYGYRVPWFENLAQYERAQISLIDERFAQFMYAQNLEPGVLEKEFINELTSIDSDVYRAQIAYLSTILISPISGTVTGVYKHPGDAVRPGEPVLRVESSDFVFLLATLAYRGPISIGSKVTVETKLYGLPGPWTPPIVGIVVAVRGRQVDDNWDVIVKCNNLDTSGKHILPLGYHFDHWRSQSGGSSYDDTKVSIS